MKFLFLNILYIVFSLQILSGQVNYSPENIQDNLTISAVKLDANQVSTWFRNNSGFNRSPPGNPGFEWPIGSNLFARSN